MDSTVYLLPDDDGWRLYAEPPDDPPHMPAHGRLARWLHGAGESWRRLVLAAQSMPTDASRLTRWRHQLVCVLDDRINAQRVYWHLRQLVDVHLVAPAAVEARAAVIAVEVCREAMKRHRTACLLHLVGLVLAAPFALAPGPNLPAYYFGVSAFGHWQAWRGARAGVRTARWHIVRASTTVGEDLRDIFDPR